MTSLADQLNADRRLRILRLLHQMPGHVADARLLQGALDSGWRHDVALDVVQADLMHLQTHGCLTMQGDGGRITGQLTQKGEDVGFGRTLVPGVARPSHEERAAGVMGLSAEIAGLQLRG